MATLPGMRADVYFGEPDAPLPDWRKAPVESDSDAPPTPDERKALVSMLGFDPAELEEEEEPRRHRRRGKPRRQDAGTWITIGGHPGEDGEKHVGGSAVLIDKEGRIIGGNVPRSLHGTPVHEFANAIRTKEPSNGNRTEPEPGEQAGERAASQPDAGQPEGAGRPVADEAGRPGGAAAGQGGPDGNQSAGQGAARAVPRAVPRQIHEVNGRIDRYAGFFRAKGQHEVAGWLDKLKQHVNEVGVESALESLGGELPAGSAAGHEAVQYQGKSDDISHFAQAYLNREGISLLNIDQAPSAGTRAISSVAPAFGGYQPAEGYTKGKDGSFWPKDPTLRDKLAESKALPGLESSEDLGAIMGGKQVTALTPDVTAKLDAKYGKGKWIVKTYDDNAFAGRGIFFPQRSEQIKRDAQSAIWSAGENLARYGFRIGRDPDTGRAFGLVHDSGDIYQFGTPEYENTIHGDARHWADRAQAAAANEQGAAMPQGEDGRYWAMMAQPAFEVVGASEAARAAGKTWEGTREGRVHIVTRNGKAELVPHSTWIKGDHLPVVFEDDYTRAMAQAAVDAINALPESDRQGQIYAPDIVNTTSGPRVVEANPANETGSSGYLSDNPFIIDSYVSKLTGREPAHVRFIRQLLSDRRQQGQRQKAPAS